MTSDEYNYYPNPGNYDFDDDSLGRQEDGNCPCCGKAALRSGGCGSMDTGGLTKCMSCGWNTDFANWTDTEMRRLRAENERLRIDIAHAILAGGEDSSIAILRDTLGNPTTKELWKTIKGEDE